MECEMGVCEGWVRKHVSGRELQGVDDVWLVYILRAGQRTVVVRT